MKKYRLTLLLATLMLNFFNVQLLTAQDSTEIQLSKIYFSQLDSICMADNGKLWGVNLYGPTMFVIPESRKIIANRQASNGKLIEKDNVFIGELPLNINISNTSFNWDGVDWTMVSWDAIPENDPYSRNKLLVHESWHRIQNQIGIPSILSSNPHLDNLQGSILFKLEFIILKHAFLANEKSDIINAINDALTVRQYRQLLFSNNNENQFERHEGMAEYTGFKLCGLNYDILKKAMEMQLDFAINKDGLTNSFAYISGPAYGFLFDGLTSNWISQIKAGKSLPDIGVAITGKPITADTATLKATVKDIIAKYNAEQMVKSETEKFELQKKLITEYKERILNGNQLIIPNNNINFSYNPQEPLIPIDNIGVVYKTMRLVGEWGILEVSNGILRTNDWKAFVINAPQSIDQSTINEANYTLTLNANWVIVKVKEGKFTIKKK